MGFWWSQKKKLLISFQRDKSFRFATYLLSTENCDKHMRRDCNTFPIDLLLLNSFTIWHCMRFNIGEKIIGRKYVRSMYAYAPITAHNIIIDFIFSFDTIRSGLGK